MGEAGVQRLFVQKRAQPPVVLLVIHGHEHRVYGVLVLAADDEEADGLFALQHLVQMAALLHHGAQPVGIALAAQLHGKGGIDGDPVTDEDSAADDAVNACLIFRVGAFHHGQPPVEPGDGLRHMVVLPANLHMEDRFHKGVAQPRQAEQQLRAVHRAFEHDVLRALGDDALFFLRQRFDGVLRIQRDFPRVHADVFTLPDCVRRLHAFLPPAAPRTADSG